MSIRKNNLVISGGEANAVHKTGNETIAGIKTFVNGIVAPNVIDTTRLTNCIKYIPQDLDIILSDGLLTLKSGSKITVPKGSGIYDEVTTESDIVLMTGSSNPNGEVLVFIMDESNALVVESSKVDSGTVAPGVGYKVWFDTTLNRFKYSASANNSWSTRDISFPLCICTVVNGVVTTIKNVFNGFGYFGKSVYCLKNVEGYAFDGYNDNGTVKNIEWKISGIQVVTHPSTDNGYYYVLVNELGILSDATSFDYKVDLKKTSIILTNVVNGRVNTNDKIRAMVIVDENTIDSKIHEATYFENIKGEPSDNAKLNQALLSKVDKNDAIIGSTKCKITYDSKGLVTSGTDLTASDIPNLTLSKITDVTATAAEVNVLDGITATTAELNYVDGVTSNIQTQLNNRVVKNNDITGATKCKITYDSKGLVTAGADLSVSDIPSLTLSKISDVTATASEVNVLDGITATTTELNYVDGVTSNIQTQLNNKVTANSAITNATKCKISYDSKGLVTAGYDLSSSDIPNLLLSKITDVTATATEVNVLDGITATTTELNYTDGVTSNIQTQLNNRVVKNNDITGSTKCKITYDSKGLVTSGADLTASDIPSLSLSKISDVTATATELNVLDGITATTTELNYVDGVTSNIQTQLNGKLTTNDILNVVNSTATNKALSANMGKELQDQINNLKQRGRYLSVWNCVTGKATTDPTVNPYTYKAGDYFIVGTIASGSGTNYRPNGATYDKDVPSTTVETGTVIPNDTYYYDGTNWSLLHTEQPTVAFSTLAGDPYDNTNLTTALNAKVTGNSAITGATKCKITYDSKGLVTSGADLSASDIPNLTLAKITDVTATASEVNVLDGITATTTELNYTDGVTSNIQTQLNNKVEKNNAITGATKTKITYDSKGLVTGGADLTASDIPSLSLSKISDVTATASEVNVLDGITATTAELNVLDGITATTTELNYTDGVTSNIQTQLNNKQPSGNYVSYTNNTAVVAGTSKTVSKTNPDCLFVGNGLIMGGTAQSAGLTTRGICGVVTPDATTGACAKDNLYLNYDGNDTNNPNGRGVVINAGSVGTDLGNGMYSYCAVRGDVVKSWVEAKGYLTSSTKYGKSVSYSNSTLTLKDQDGTTLSTATIDALPSQSGQSGKYLTTNGTTASWATVSSMPETDNTTINVSSQSKLQAIGIIDKNSNSAKYDWVGTLAQYNALTTKYNNWTYFITDDDLDENIVHITGNETITGTKTFTSIIVGTTPSEDTTSSTQVDTVGARNTKLSTTFQVVDELPASPVAGVFYFIKESS